MTVAARSVIATSPLKYRTIHDIMVDIPSDYPSTAPFVKMLSSPYVFHPNWYSDGRWCHGQWSETEGLGDFIVRMVKTLFYDREITNPESPANTNANDWYKNKDNARYFPIPPLNLPDPSGRSFKIQRKFSILK